jgi:hypothetical protein
MERTSQLKVTEYKGFGGSFYDSIAHSALYRDDNPYDFGVMTARLFSSTNNLGLTNKKWNYLTMAQGNYYVIPGGRNEYTWSVVGDADIDFRFTQLLVGAADQNGKANTTFAIAIDRNWVKAPVVLKTEDDNAPLLEIVSGPEPLGAHSWKYEVRLVDSNPNMYIPSDLLAPGRVVTRVSTSVSNEENTKYGTDQYASMEKLRGVVGQYANEVNFTDRFIRMELAAAKNGGSQREMYEDSDGTKHRDAFARGHIYQASLKAKHSNEKIERGFFIPAAEKRLLERTEMDREMMCEFGRFSISTDQDSKRIKKVAPGWRQLVREGQYMPHAGDFTLSQLHDFLHQIFYRRRNFMNREPMLVAGTGAITYLSTLIASQVPVAQTLEPGFALRDNNTPTGVHKYEKEWGFQFTKILLPMGITVSIMYDPRKDDDTLFKTKAPGSYLPLESFQIDILDFGKTEDAAENSNGKNITMVMEDNIDYYFSVSNAIDFKNGVVKNGENVYKFGKTHSIYREMSGSLAVWDTSAIGRIEWVI